MVEHPGAAGPPARPEPPATVVLDLDDVLCMSWPYGGRDLVNAYAGIRGSVEAILPHLFAPKAVAILRRAHERLESRVRYVISSTWREFFTREQMVHIFTQGGLDFVAENLVAGDAWCTPVQPEPAVRRLEIEEWLAEHGRGEPFVIIDDTYSGTSLLRMQSDSTHPWHWRTVICKECVGLEDEHLGEIVAALKLPVT